MIPRFSPNYSWKTLALALLPAPKNSIDRLEREFAQITGHPQALFFRYGRSGLYFLLKALNKPGLEVVLPSDTCVVIAHAIHLAGYKLVFLDNAEGMRQPSSQQFIDAVNSRTAMVIPTHLYGFPQETAEMVQKIKNKYPEVFILQDCAHSFFCEDASGTPVTRWGDGALFGMNISKLINSVKGGMLTLRDESLANEIRGITQKKCASSALKDRLYVFAAIFAFSPPITHLLNFLRRHTSLLNSQTQYFDDAKIDLPKDFDEKPNLFSAVIGLQSLKSFPSRIKNRRSIALLYTETLKSIASPDLIWFPSDNRGATWSHYPVLVLPEKRNLIIKKLEAALNAEVGIIVDYSVADLPSYKELGHSSTPICLQESKSIINLPLTWFETNIGLPLKQKDAYDLIRKSLRKVFGRNL